MTVLVLVSSSQFLAYADNINTKEQAICGVRDNMVNKNTFFYVEIDSLEEVNYGTVEEIINKAMTEKYKNSPTSGLYLLTNLSRFVSEIDQNGTHYKIFFWVKYVLTSEQENEMFTKIKEIVSPIQSLSEYDKVKYINDYIINKVDYDSSDKMSYTPYSAIFYGKTCCTGYSVLFQFMCQEVGIDAKVLSGQGHAWNIVRIDGKYYNLDITYADSQNDIDYFLKCDKHFYNHNSGTNDDYAMASVCYGGCAKTNNKETSQSTDNKSSLKKPKSQLPDVSSAKKIVNKNIKPKIKKIKQTKKAVYIECTKYKNIDGYIIEYSSDKNFKNAKRLKTKGTKNNKIKISKSKKAKKYYLRVRTYRLVKSADGKTVKYKVYSDWSKTKIIKK